MRPSFHSAAAGELRRIAERYDAEVPSLGREILQELDRVMGQCRENPELGARLTPIHRRVVLDRFPYSVIYRVDEDVIRIIAVAHYARKPGYWKRRG
jgi:toxin ParE1/3/4